MIVRSIISSEIFIILLFRSQKSYQFIFLFQNKSTTSIFFFFKSFLTSEVIFKVNYLQNWHTSFQIVCCYSSVTRYCNLSQNFVPFQVYTTLPAIAWCIFNSKLKCISESVIYINWSWPMWGTSSEIFRQFSALIQRIFHHFTFDFTAILFYFTY